MTVDAAVNMYHIIDDIEWSSHDACDDLCFALHDLAAEYICYHSCL